MGKEIYQKNICNYLNNSCNCENFLTSKKEKYNKMGDTSTTQQSTTINNLGGEKGEMIITRFGSLEIW